MATLFFSYSHRDEALRDELQTQLAMLQRQGIIETWHDRKIEPGTAFDKVIGAHVERDDILLLLVSPDFLASDYCYEVEMMRAIERHEAGEAVVLPVILRACDWKHAPFGKLLAVPTDGKPVTLWPDRDQAFLEVANAIRTAAASLTPQMATRESPAMRSVLPLERSAVVPEAPRSSNLALAKTFSDRDKDEFLHGAFDYMVRFFETSLDELGARNQGIEGSIRRIDADRFFATVYRDGAAAARCTIFMGGMLGRAIYFLEGQTSDTNSFSECLHVEADDQSCFLRAMGMNVGRDRAAKLTFEGASEMFWAAFIRPLQH